MKRAYDKGMIDKSWIDDYCLNGGETVFVNDGLKSKAAYLRIMCFPMALWMKS